MAQDELGHARSTYPVLASSASQREDDGPRRGRALALLDARAAGLGRRSSPPTSCVDGVLTTFVAACARQLVRAARPARAQDPPGGGLAPRPRARRGRGGSAGGERRPRAARARARATRGSRPHAGPAPTTIRAARPPSPTACSRVGPAALRERVRAWPRRTARHRAARRPAAGAGRLVGLVRRCAPLRPPPSPPIAASAAARSAARSTSSWCRAWARQIITSQWRCRACGSYFEAVRDDFAADAERG